VYVYFCFAITFVNTQVVMMVTLMNCNFNVRYIYSYFMCSIVFTFSNAKYVYIYLLLYIAGLAAIISCPAEVTLVRISNDATQPADKRRNYTSVGNAFQRILREEGVKTFFSGSGPFVNRAMVVGAVQVGTYDQFRGMYKDMGVTHELLNVFYASMTSGFIYAVVTMPLETAKNRMAFQVCYSVAVFPT
jgi:hypothetical protein